MAGLIEGTYSGLSGPDGGAHARIGVNVPRTKIAQGGFSVISLITPYVGDPSLFDGFYGNGMQIGAELAGLRTGAPLIKPEEAWNLDTKLDDGKPAQGKILGDKRDSPTRPNCTTTNDSAAEYMLTNSDRTCRVIMRSIQ